MVHARDRPNIFSSCALIPALPFLPRAGKTCIVNTAMESEWGVVRVGSSEEKIVTNALMALTRSNLAFVNPGPAAARVLWWHDLLFRMPPTIVLQAGERLPGEGYAAISGSCRALVEFGFRVIVDASHYSLSDSATATKRELVLVVEPMAREMLENLEGLGGVIGALRKAKLDGVMWGVVGGNPADYFGLKTLWDKSGRGDVAAVTVAFVSEQLDKAIKARNAALQDDRRFAELYARYMSADFVLSSEAYNMDAKRPSPDKVLREAIRDNEAVLIPASEAMAVVLRHGQKKPSMNALKEMFPTTGKVDGSGEQK
jgi:hypothetical protein